MAKNDTYDIVKAIDAIENELIASMIRNMKNHKVEEIDEDKQWSMWQAEQLKSLEQYRRSNEEKFGSEFEKINNSIEMLIRLAKDEGEMDQEIEILKAIRKGFKGNKVSKGATAEFFKLNERKLDALITATVSDMQKAETAILRMANDQYRKIIYNAQVYANTGAGTYEKAVDMATKDMLSAGLNCVEYKNGARHTLKDYTDMAIRTASKRAYLQGEGAKRQEWGVATVIMNKRGNPCPKCLPFCGKVLIDDVWSGGSKEDGNYPLMSYAISQGLYHPRCKDSHTTYFPGISSADDTWTKKELEDIGLKSKEEAKQQYAKRQVEKFERLAEHSLDKDNKRMYQNRAEQWHDILNDGDSRDDLVMVEKDDIDDFLASKKQYDDNVKKIQLLEKETDDLLDQYMEAMDTPDEERLEKLHGEKYDELESLKEVAKDLKAQLSGKEAKAVRHVEKNLANMLGIDSSKVNMTGMPYDSADMVYKSYKSVLNKYPELKGHLTEFVYDNSKHRAAYASCNAITGKITAYNKFRNFDGLVKAYADDVACKFHPIGTDHNSIIVHELGHALDGHMTCKGLLGGKVTSYGTIRTSTDVRKMVLDKLGWFDEVRKIKDVMTLKGASYRQITDEIDKQRKVFITNHISEYANDNANEFFAECFAEYMMSDKPRDAAKIFGEIIENALGR